MRLRKGHIVVFLLWMLIPTVGACSNERHVEWTEDVKLSDGRMILVKRTEDYRRIMDVGAGFQRGWLFQKSSISAELPAPIQRKVVWEGSLKPLVLDIHPDGSVYLVCRVATGAAQIEWKVPDHEFYVPFRLTPENWQRIPLVDLPTSVLPNLLGNTYTLFIDRETQSGIHVDFKQKKELDSNARVTEDVRSITRLPAPTPKK